MLATLSLPMSQLGQSRPIREGQRRVRFSPVRDQVGEGNERRYGPRATFCTAEKSEPFRRQITVKDVTDPNGEVCYHSH